MSGGVDVLSVIAAVRRGAHPEPFFSQLAEMESAVAELIESGTAMASLYDGPDCSEQEDLAASHRFKKALAHAQGRVS